MATSSTEIMDRVISSGVLKPLTWLTWLICLVCASLSETATAQTPPTQAVDAEAGGPDRPTATRPPAPDRGSTPTACPEAVTSASGAEHRLARPIRDDASSACSGGSGGGGNIAGILIAAGLMLPGLPLLMIYSDWSEAYPYLGWPPAIALAGVLGAVGGQITFVAFDSPRGWTGPLIGGFLGAGAGAGVLYLTTTSDLDSIAGYLVLGWLGLSLPFIGGLVGAAFSDKLNDYETQTPTHFAVAPLPTGGLLLSVSGQF